MKGVLAHTDFAGAGLCIEKYAASVSKTATGEQVVPERLTGFHGLQSKIAAHGFGNVVAIFAVLDALLGDVFDLGSSVSLLAKAGVVQK